MDSPELSRAIALSATHVASQRPSKRQAHDKADPRSLDCIARAYHSARNVSPLYKPMAVLIVAIATRRWISIPAMSYSLNYYLLEAISYHAMLSTATGCLKAFLGLAMNGRGGGKAWYYTWDMQGWISKALAPKTFKAPAEARSPGF